METKQTTQMQRVSLHDKVLGQIIKMMEGGKMPWRCPWKVCDMSPTNLSTGEMYRGFNAFWLGMLGGSKYWLGMRQANEMGGKVRKGEPGTPIIFPRLKKISQKDTDGEKKESTTLCGFSGAYVWNLSQIEGIREPKGEGENKCGFNPIESAEQIVANMPNAPKILHGANRAAYLPKLDLVRLPNKADFESVTEYYSVLFHELSHATGHETRLNRKEIAEPSRFGSHEYSKEELIAEFSSSYLCAQAGIERETLQNSAAYIQGWAQALQEDKSMLFFAAAQAEKAAQYILGTKELEKMDEPATVAA